MNRIFFFIGLALIIALCSYYFFPESQLKAGQKADKIIVNKSDHVLQLYHRGKLIATYSVSISRKGLDPKTKCGDNLTPEGQFRVSKRNKSNYHKAIDVGYGCDVLIHGLKYEGLGKFQRWMDWTKGCIALTNNEIDEVYSAIDNGCPIEINH